MAAPNTQNTPHSTYSGGSPSYVGGSPSASGQVGFFQDPNGAQFLATISGTTMTVLQLVTGTIVIGQVLTNAGGAPVSTSGVVIISRGTATAQDGAGALGTWNLSSSLTYATATLFSSADGAVPQPSSLNASTSINYNLPQTNAMYTATSAAGIVKYQAQILSTTAPATSGITATSSVTSTLQIVGSMFQPPPASTSISVFAINKPTHQAGIAVGAVRCLTTGIFSVDYAQLTGTGTANTATDVYDIIEFKQSPLTATATVTPPLLLPQSTQEVTVTVGTGIALPGYAVVVNKPQAQTTAGSTVIAPVMAARVTGVNTVAITLGNPGTTAAGITPTSEAYNFAFVPQINATNPFQVYGFPANQNSSTASTMVEATNTVTGLLLTDTPVGVTRVSSAVLASTTVMGASIRAVNQGTLLYITPNGAQADTTNAVYPVTILRQNAANPVQMYYPTLTGTTAAASTTVEVTTTVTGLLVSSSVIVNKPTYTPGIAVVNARVSAANVLAVTYANFTTSSITVPAEVYTVANVQLQGPGSGITVTAGNFVGVTYNPGQQESIRNAQALRNSLVSLNLIAGV
jgi:hypothetical protein